MKPRVGLVLSLALIGAFAAWLYAVTATPTYSARAYLATTSGTPDAEHYAQAYAQLATGAPVLAKAAALLGPDSAGLDRVTASTPRDQPVIQIVARNVSATRAVTVANAVARALAAYGSERLSQINAGLTVVAPATVPDRPSSPPTSRYLLIGASAGLLVGALAALLSLRRRPKPEPARPQPVRPTFDDPAEIAGHLGIWRAQYGGRTVTAYRSAAALAEPGEFPRAEPVEVVSERTKAILGEPTKIIVVEPGEFAPAEPAEIVPADREPPEAPGEEPCPRS